MFQNPNGNWTNDNLLHNRLNFKAFAGKHLILSVEMRNRFFWGETVKYLPGYGDWLSRDRGWKDLTWNLIEDSSCILNTTVDRINLDFRLGNFQLTAGRQRINWGMNWVWNPNDLFNSYSFFDFDYVERPGSDAIRLQYYLNYSTHLELVAKMNEQDQYSLAGLFRFNLYNFDFQVLGGILDETDYAFGGGFSGNLGPVSLTGEITFLDPVKENDPRSNATVAGMGLAYNTPFNLFIQAEYLYNSAAGDETLYDFTGFYYRDLNLRNLSFAPHTWFANFSYPITPLLTGGVALMTFPKLHGLFTGPSIDWSLCQNFDLSFIIQYFSIRFQQQDTQKITLGFLRLKWNF